MSYLPSSQISKYSSGSGSGSGSGSRSGSGSGSGSGSRSGSRSGSSSSSRITVILSLQPKGKSSKRCIVNLWLMG